MHRVIGRLDELAGRAPRARERRFGDRGERWSFAANREWLADGVRRREPFVQVSAAEPGSVLAWEVAQLRRLRCVQVGPLWVPANWFHDRESYVRTVRLAAEHALALPAHGAAVYVPKARGELEPLLAMWPFVLLLPTAASLSIDELIAARAWPVHPLGVVAQPAPADGALRSPAEYFFHDVDHARFKVREDLLARGVAIDDPYAGGTTFDAARGVHRCVMAAALPHVGPHGWSDGARRAALARGWLDTIAAEPSRALGDAMRWLLFELVHEKSLPLDPTVLGAALATAAHVDKLRAKCDAGFYAEVGPSRAAVARLFDARRRLRTIVEAAR